MIKSFQDLNEHRQSHLLFETIAGSKSYGTNHSESDEDLKGIFILPAEHYLMNKSPIQQLSDERNDLVYYSLKRFLELAANANPNIIEMLYMPKDCLKFQSPLLDPLFRARDIFITKKAYESHVNYAQAQIKKARGKNKWVNNPQPKDRPAKEQFCYYIPMIPTDEMMPMRPMKLIDSAIDLSDYHVSSVEHSSDLYRLYYYGKSAQGVFRNGQIVCESIPLEDEMSHCRGLLLFNVQAYEMALRNHRQYWQWKGTRNEKRWQSQEDGQRDYDAKNMLHTMRLLLSAKNILLKSEPIVRFAGEKLDLLTRIRKGEFSYSELISKIEDELLELHKIYEACELPDEVDESKLHDLLIEITNNWLTETER